jgi:single-strand DNA-binding protein
MYVNKVTILGNLTRDPEVKSLPNGNKVASFSVATNEVYKDAQGQKKEKVEFHNVIFFGKTAENIGMYMKKGSQVYIEGKLQTRSWDDKTTGEKKYRTEILGSTIQFGSKPQGSASAPTEAKPDVVTGGADLDTIDFGDVNVDDIPF